MDDTDARLIRQIPLFFGLSPRQLQAFLRICRTSEVDDSDHLCRFGDTSNRLYILIEGRLEIISPSGVSLTFVEPVTTVGEMGFMSRRPRSATVRAAGTCRLLTVEYHDFEAMIENNHELSARVYRNTVRILYDKLGNANEQLASYRAREFRESESRDGQGERERDSETDPAATGARESPPVVEAAETVADIPSSTADAEPPADDLESGSEEPVAGDVASAEASDEGAPGSSEPDRVAGDRHVRDLDDGEASRFVIDFYSLADLELDPGQLERDKSIVREMWRQGYSAADLDYAIRWTLKNIPGAKRFNMVKLSIDEAFEHKWKT